MRKIALYRFNQGAHPIAGGLKWEQGAKPPGPLTLTTGSVTEISILAFSFDSALCMAVIDFLAF